MQLRSVHLIYFSPTHTSKKIGESILQGISAEQTIVTDLTYGMRDHSMTVADDLTLFVVPVYGGRVAETAMERLDKINGEGKSAVFVVVYGNRDYEDALIELKDWGEGHDFIPLAGAAFIGEHSFSRTNRPIAGGRPDAGDIQKAVDFGHGIRQMFTKLKTEKDIVFPKIKGNYPYKAKSPKTPQAPITEKEECVLCGHCAEVCPVGAILLDENVNSDAELCIKCCACVKECPSQARIFDTPYTDMLFKNFSNRREPELFMSE